MPALFSLPVSRLLGPEYVPMVSDMARMVCLQGFVQMMTYLSGDGAGAMSGVDWVVLVLYIWLGVLFYWCVLRRTVAVE